MINTFYGIVAIFMWGSLALLGSHTKDIPAFQLLSLCFFISALIMLVKRISTKQPVFTLPKLSVTQWWVGVGALFGFHFCYFMALKQAPAIEVSLISYLWPILFALMLSTKANILRCIVGSSISFIGVSVIILSGHSLSFNTDYAIGYGLAFSCAVIWSSYSWFMSTTDNNIDDIGWLSFGVACVSLCAHLLLEQSQWTFSFAQWVWILLLGIGPVGGAFYCWDAGVKHGNKTLLASLSFLTPVMSSLFLTVFGVIAFSPYLVMSLLFILFGGAVANNMSIWPLLKTKIINRNSNIL